MAGFKPDQLNFTPTYHTEPYPFISPQQYDLSDVAVLITGASRGIGLAMAQSFAAAGASKIAITARQAPTDHVAAITAAAASASKPAPTVLALSLDVSDPASVDALAAAMRARFGRLDILVNNAGYLENWAAVARSDADEWWKVMTTNVRGPFLLCRALLPLLLDGGGGRKTVVNVSSVGALRVRPGASGYQTSKFALLRIGEFLEAEYGEQGLVTISIHPGGVLTDLAKGMPSNMHGILVDKPELAGDTAVWLTAERREWLSGRYVSVNWDMEELLKEEERIVKGDLLKMKLAV